jgi:very-short-patch-repair endonuclease
MNYSEIKRIATILRNNPAPAEVLLWNELRRRNLKYKFLRQHPVIYESNKKEHFFYIPDFYCDKKKLVIEVDGKIHDFQKEYDYNREQVLTGTGLHILRFKNEELKDMKSTVKKIIEVLEGLP